MRRFALLVLTLACLAPATAVANVYDFGSDLSLPATAAHNSGPDISYWNVGPQPALGSYVAPEDGQVTVVKLKGALLPNERLRNTDAEKIAQIIHFQTLRERGDGTLKIVTLSTGHMTMPISDRPDELVTDYKPVNLCVKKGDIVAFNTIGAHEYRRDAGAPGGPQGAEYQVFGIAPDMVTQWYSKDNGLNEGTTIQPSPNDVLFRHELLMRTTLATGPDATDICPGGYAQHIFRGLDFKSDYPRPSVRTKERIARPKVFCHGENYGGCFGNLKIEAVLDGVPTLVGQAKFAVKNSHTVIVDVPVAPDVLLKIQQARRVTATVTAEASDNPRQDDRAKWDSVPVQSKTTTGEMVLEPDRLPCVVPAKLVGKSSKVAKAMIRKAGCKTKVKYKKAKKRSQAGKVLAVSPAAGSVLAANAAVTITIGRSK